MNEIVLHKRSFTTLLLVHVQPSLPCALAVAGQDRAADAAADRDDGDAGGAVGQAMPQECAKPLHTDSAAYRLVSSIGEVPRS